MARTSKNPRISSASSLRWKTLSAIGYRPSSGELGNVQRARARYLKYKAKAEVEKTAVAAPEAVSHTSGTQALSYRPVANPRATLLGLPTELRLQIYAYLSGAILIHVHSPKYNKFTWTPCKAANPTYPLLCANPKWSGLCREEDRCTFKHAAPPDPRGFWGLAATCKLFHSETQQFLMVDSVFSIHPLNVRGWLKWLKKHVPKKLKLIRKVTLAGPDHPLHFPQYVFSELKYGLPSLEAVGLQCQSPRYSWIDNLASATIKLESDWFRWNLVESMEIFAPTITVVVEGLIYIKRQRYVLNGKIAYYREQQAVVRVSREGKEKNYEGTAWEPDDVELEIVQPRALVEGKRNAQWRIWWGADELKYFG